MKIVSKILQLLLGITFLFSAYTKAVGPGFFEITLMDQGIAPDRIIASYLARFFIGLEFALGFLMLLPFYVFRGVVSGSFTGVLSYNHTVHHTDANGKQHKQARIGE